MEDLTWFIVEAAFTSRPHSRADCVVLEDPLDTRYEIMLATHSRDDAVSRVTNIYAGQIDRRQTIYAAFAEDGVAIDPIPYGLAYTEEGEVFVALQI